MDRTIFRIWDSKKEDFWTSHTGKDIWLTIGAAKGSWNYDARWNWRFSTQLKQFEDMNFNNQNRFIIQEYDLVLKKIYHANT